MKKTPAIHLSDVQSVYSGPEGRLWQLLMGEQIHIGGFISSLDLARRANLTAGLHGVDLCCCLGAGMRFLLRFTQAANMTGVDATRAMLDLGRQRAVEEGLTEQMQFVEADVCATGLPAQSFDFVWGEDAWCYVENKPHLIAEAVRLLKPGGTVAFTDWLEGPVIMTEAEAERFLKFMKFPNILSLAEYGELLRTNGCTLQVAEDTGRFPKYVPLYLDMMEKQLTYDALKIINFDTALAQTLTAEMRFMQTLAEAQKIIQGIIVATRT